MIIYLCGGMRSGWQDKVISKLDKEHFKILDPRDNLSDTPNLYTEMDYMHIRKCDIVLAYAESENTSLLGLSAEIGFAKALNKLVILVYDLGLENNKHFQFVKYSANVMFYSIEDAVDYIENFQI